MKKLGVGCLAIIGAFVVIVIIVAALGMGGSDSGNDTASGGSGGGKSSSGGSKSTPAKKKAKGVLNAEAGAANRVKKGGGYRLGDFKIHKGWTVKKYGMGLGYGIEDLEVENMTSDDHQFSVDFKLHQGAHRIVASITCLADEAHPKDIVQVDCLPDGSTKPYDYITVENSF